MATVRIQDIAVLTKISPGNLTYHYKTKKDLMKAVLNFLREIQKESFPPQFVIEADSWIDLIQTYLRFQVQFRFFYRDILEITNILPESRIYYKNQIEEVINFNVKGFQLAVNQGYMIPEPHEKHYEVLAANTWAIINSWLTVREVLGEKKISLPRGAKGILELLYPYLTIKGKEFYHQAKEQIHTLVYTEMYRKEELTPHNP